MNKVTFALFTFALVAALAGVSIEAYPSWSRQKRVSDQRIAELETLLALARLRGRLATVPVGYGLINPAKIGRKKRAHQPPIQLEDDHHPLNKWQNYYIEQLTDQPEPPTVPWFNHNQDKF